MQTERVTRSRARTMAGTGDTREWGRQEAKLQALSLPVAPFSTCSPSSRRLLLPNTLTAALTALPAKTPATRATTRRRGAAAATAPPAAGAPASTAEEVQPVVLFDVTNDQVNGLCSSGGGFFPSAWGCWCSPQYCTLRVAAHPRLPPLFLLHQDGAVPAAVVPVPAGEEPEAAPAPAAEASADAAAPAAEPSADEPPATPAHSASPAPAAPSATPTGLGLSNLLPQSPLAATLPAATPAATPLGGAPADGGRVAQALHAAVEVSWVLRPGGLHATPTLC